MDTPKIISAPDGVQEVLRRCLQGEEVPLDVQGVRERVLRIGRVVPVVGDPEGAELCARWLVGGSSLVIFYVNRLLFACR